MSFFHLIFPCANILFVLDSTPGARFSNVPVTFQVRKAVFRVCFQDRSFNNFENDMIKLTVNEAEMTGL